MNGISGSIVCRQPGCPAVVAVFRSGRGAVCQRQVERRAAASGVWEPVHDLLSVLQLRKAGDTRPRAGRCRLGADDDLCVGKRLLRRVQGFIRSVLRVLGFDMGVIGQLADRGQHTVHDAEHGVLRIEVHLIRRIHIPKGDICHGRIGRRCGQPVAGRHREPVSAERPRDIYRGVLRSRPAASRVVSQRAAGKAQVVVAARAPGGYRGLRIQYGQVDVEGGTCREMEVSAVVPDDEITGSDGALRLDNIVETDTVVGIVISGPGDPPARAVKDADGHILTIDHLNHIARRNVG